MSNEVSSMKVSHNLYYNFVQVFLVYVCLYYNGFLKFKVFQSFEMISFFNLKTVDNHFKHIIIMILLVIIVVMHDICCMIKYKIYVCWMTFFSFDIFHFL